MSRTYLSPAERRLEQLPDPEGQLFRELHEIGAHLQDEGRVHESQLPLSLDEILPLPGMDA